MNRLQHEIEELFFSFKKLHSDSIEKLPQSGSDREYYKIFCNTKTFIATYNLNIKENNAFIYFSNHFKQAGLPVPEIYIANNAGTIYIQQYLGNASLLNELELHGFNNYVFNLFKKTLQQLAKLQIYGSKNLDYSMCLTAKEFGRQAIFSDLLYFKYYFLDTIKFPYDKQALLDDFEILAAYLTKAEHKFFMFRDFQSRNIVVNNNEVFFIDYQGGMQGALQYDVASLLWQAKAQLTNEWKASLLKYYIQEADKLLEVPVNKITFTEQYYGYVLVRLLQVLGAYGFRGLFERKAHFLTSIPLALRNLKEFIESGHLRIELQELNKILRHIVADEIIQKFKPLQANEQTTLVISIKSFSYRYGIPQDESGNGGGFVFDCRGILNPGRLEEYKILSGKDKKVIDFLEQQTRMTEFLNSVFDVINVPVENYIERGFGNLLICFGCTGGQHRSVYAAEQTARHLKNKYKVKVEICHSNESNWVCGL